MIIKRILKKAILWFSVTVCLNLGLGLSHSLPGQETDSKIPDTVSIRNALDLIGLPFTTGEIIQMQRGLADQKRNLLSLRTVDIPNQWIPALTFNPVPRGYTIPATGKLPVWPGPTGIHKPLREADIAFLTLPELSELLATGQLTSVELTKLYINRIKKFQDTLLCVVTLTEELALAQAAEADREISAGRKRGLLHGIPYGIKDLFAVPGYPTTWGAGPYRDQLLEETAHVVQKLNAAGAVLVAKLTTGALAMGDVWFGGTTRNPWNLTRGSSGSSAGPASATAAGLVAFSIGTETLGSIVSPSTRCGITGLRPTFGRIGRSGVMALSWSMDKVGPICRNSLDCAIVLDAIRGLDPLDPATIDADFSYQHRSSLNGLKIGYLNQSDTTAIRILRQLGAELVPAALPDQFPVQALRLVLTAEAAAAFDDLTRSDRDSLLNSQKDYDWPNTFRLARLIPAVEYIQANRIREKLIEETNLLIEQYDLILAPTFAGNQLTLTNLTGHPCLVIPNGQDTRGNPQSICLIGRLFAEDVLCEAGQLYQEQTQYYRLKPDFFSK